MTKQNAKYYGIRHIYRLNELEYPFTYYESCTYHAERKKKQSHYISFFVAFMENKQNACIYECIIEQKQITQNTGIV